MLIFWRIFINFGDQVMYEYSNSLFTVECFLTNFRTTNQHCWRKMSSFSTSIQHIMDRRICETISYFPRRISRKTCVCFYLFLFLQDFYLGTYVHNSCMGIFYVILIYFLDIIVQHISMRWVEIVPEGRINAFQIPENKYDKKYEFRPSLISRWD